MLCVFLFEKQIDRYAKNQKGYSDAHVQWFSYHYVNNKPGIDANEDKWCDRVTKCFIRSICILKFFPENKYTDRCKRKKYPFN